MITINLSFHTITVKFSLELGDEINMNIHYPQPKFDELEVGHILQKGEMRLRIIEIDYRRHIVYYREVGGGAKSSGTLTESSYAQQCRTGAIHAV